MDKHRAHVRRPRNNMEDAMQMTGEKLTSEQTKALKATFKALDLNHDGRISSTDLKRACKQMGLLLTKEELQGMMIEADNDGNGFIDYQEFEKLIAPQIIIANYKLKCLKEKFKVFDKDGDGFITEEEIKHVFTNSGMEFTDDEIKELMEEADENKDGVISFDEFVKTVCDEKW